MNISGLCRFQVASQETYGTLGAIVKSRTGNMQVGFLTNRHVAVDLEYPNQKMFHPLPPNLGPGVYLGAVERATSFITDDLWYGMFAGTNPGNTSPVSCWVLKVIVKAVFYINAETFVRADGAFIPFSDDFDISSVTTLVKGVGEIGDVKTIDLQSPINSLIGRQVMKVGRSSGLTTGIVMAYALEYNDEKGICFLTDFLVVGENQQTFDLEGDSGSLIMLTAEDGGKPEPIGIIWGGMANRGRLKMKNGYGPENWTSGVDLGRVLDLLELDLITTEQAFQDALKEQRNIMSCPANSTVEESSLAKNHQSPVTEKPGDIFENLGVNINQIPTTVSSSEGGGVDVEEHQFIPILISMSPINHQNQEKEEDDDMESSKGLFALRNAADEDPFVCLHLGDDRDAKKPRISDL